MNVTILCIVLLGTIILPCSATTTQTGAALEKKNDYCLVSAAPVYGFLVMGLIRIIRGSPLEELFFFSFADLEWIEICLCLIMYPNSNYFS